VRLLDEAHGAIAKQDYAAARRWMSEAREGGADEAGTAALERDIIAAQNNAQRADDIVKASQLMQTRYVDPVYPKSARERGTEGWVDLIFTVRTDGSIAEVKITAAEPVSVFEQAAMSAVRRWRYQPVQRDGRAVEQRARVRLRFTIEK
jgi:TonB family protein